MGDPAASRTAATPPDHAVERYWRLLGADPAAVGHLVAALFTPDARFEWDLVAAPLVGHDAIAAHVGSIRARADRPSLRRVTDVEWVHRTARWCWASHGPAEVRRGMEVVRLAPGCERIELVVRFSGLLPPPVWSGRDASSAVDAEHASP